MLKICEKNLGDRDNSLEYFEKFEKEYIEINNSLELKLTNDVIFFSKTNMGLKKSLA